MVRFVMVNRLSVFQVMYVSHFEFICQKKLYLPDSKFISLSTKYDSHAQKKATIQIVTHTLLHQENGIQRQNGNCPNHHKDDVGTQKRNGKGSYRPNHSKQDIPFLD